MNFYYNLAIVNSLVALNESEKEIASGSEYDKIII